MITTTKKHDIEKAVSIIRKFGAKKIILFGSYVSEGEKANDIDIAEIERWSEVEGKSDKFGQIRERLAKKSSEGA